MTNMWGLFYVKNVGECLVLKDVYEAIRYEIEDGVKAMQRFVPEKYRIWLDDAQADLGEGVDNSIHNQPNTMLFKELCLYCFLLRYKKPKAEPFVEWALEN